MYKHKFKIEQLLNAKIIHSALITEITENTPWLLQEFPVNTYIKLFDASESLHGYRFIPNDAALLCQQIVAKFGRHHLDLYHRLVLVSLICSYENRISQRNIPESIQILMPDEFNRIINGIRKNREGFYFHENDLFAKDFGICRLKLIPCGSELIDLQSGIPRHVLFQGGISQFTNAVHFFITKAKGFKPYYESHWDRRLIKFFSRNEYDACYARIADLLRKNPQVLGMFSSSWWFDPQLETISPELSFLRTVPEENGAKLFLVGSNENAISDAIKFSSERKKLYDSGQYFPHVYMLVWQRNDMLEWSMRLKTGT